MYLIEWISEEEKTTIGAWRMATDNNIVFFIGIAGKIVREVVITVSAPTSIICSRIHDGEADKTYKYRVI